MGERWRGLPGREGRSPPRPAPRSRGRRGWRGGELGEEGDKERVMEHEPHRSDESLGVLGDGALQAANTFLKQDVGNSWRYMAAVIRGEYSLPLTHT